MVGRYWTALLYAVAFLLVVPVIVDAAAPRAVIAGRVSDASGVEPIEGAVVSLEIRLLPDGATTDNKSLPTKLAVWQVRAGADGGFSVLPSNDSIELPSGTVLSKAQLKVFAFGYDTYQSRELNLKTEALGGRRIRILPSYSDLKLPLVLRAQTPQSFEGQLDGWYAEVNNGVHGGGFPGGNQQAVKSYQPLLSLLETSCHFVEEVLGSPPAACQKASKELPVASAPVKMRVDPEPSAPQAKARTSPTEIKGSKSVPAADGGMKQPPPGN